MALRYCTDPVDGSALLRSTFFLKFSGPVLTVDNLDLIVWTVFTLHTVQHIPHTEHFTFTLLSFATRESYISSAKNIFATRYNPNSGEVETLCKT